MLRPMGPSVAQKSYLSDNQKAQKLVQLYSNAKSWKKRARANKGEGPDGSTIGSTLGKRPTMEMGGTKDFGGKLKKTEMEVDNEANKNDAAVASAQPRRAL